MMFALVANGAVGAVSRSARRASGGDWLPLVEDPATYAPNSEQTPAGFTVEEGRVVRRWRTRPEVTALARVSAAFDGQQLAVRETLATEGLAEGDEWRAPAGYHDTYPLDWVVSHGGKRWRSTVMGNAWEPGVSGWAEILEEGDIPEWRQPHAGEEYAPGALVTHNGHLWRNDLETPNGWEPGAQGAGWTDLGATDA